MFKLLIVLIAVIMFGPPDSLADRQHPVETRTPADPRGPHTIIFPHIVDGAFPNGSFFTTTFMVQLEFDEDTTCDLKFNGMKTTIGGRTDSTFHFFVQPAERFLLLQTAADQPLSMGYAVLTCADNVVHASMLLSLFDAKGELLNEATVMGTTDSQALLNFTDANRKASFYRMIMDQRDGAVLGIAIANDSDRELRIRLTAAGSNAVIAIPPRSHFARFLSDVIPESKNQVGIVWIVEIGQETEPRLVQFAVAGMRQVGHVFTTIPAHRWDEEL